ncbi:MAG: hypothetical protein ABEI75_01395 [Halobaculum sp.]
MTTARPTTHETRGDALGVIAVLGCAVFGVPAVWTRVGPVAGVALAVVVLGTAAALLASRLRVLASRLGVSRGDA